MVWCTIMAHRLSTPSFTFTLISALIERNFRYIYLVRARTLYLNINNSIQEDYWADFDNRKQEFDKFARSKDFDPLVATNWYSLTTSDFMEKEVPITPVT